MAVVLYHRRRACPSLCVLSMKPQSVLGHLVIDGFHALLGQRAGILDLLPPLPSAQQCSTPRGPNRFLNSGSFG